MFNGVLTNLEKSIDPSVVTFNDLYIRPKDGDQLLNLGQNLNPTQIKFLERLGVNPFEKFSLVGKRFIKLKARQLGFTTLSAALFFCDTINNPLRYSVIMAHDDATTRKIFEIVRRFYDNLPEDKKLKTKYMTKADLTFADIDSQIYVGTAGTSSFGQGTTVNNVLGSEVASWPNPTAITSNLFQSVPMTGNIFLESTAEGIGNYFHTEYVSAEDGDSNFIPDFSPWFDEPKYALKAPLDFQPTDKEEKRKKLYSLSNDQLVWYRSKERELKFLVKQEYPDCPHEAFISSGGDFFNAEILGEYIETAKTLKPLPTPPIHVLPVYHKECVNTQRATLTLWEYPIPGHRYLISADSSEGEEDSASDYSSADIIDVETYTQVGHFHGKVEPHVLGRIIMELGHFYNKALLVPERNNHGHTVINEILNHSNYGKMDMYTWGGLYFHKQYDAAKRQFTMKPGLPTTAQNKFLIIDALNSLTIDRVIAISSEKTLIEMLNFKSLGKGKYGAPNGLKDDRVMSLSIAAFILTNRPKEIKKTKSKVVRKGSFI